MLVEEIPVTIERLSLRFLIEHLCALYKTFTLLIVCVTAFDWSRLKDG
jgi:hypothetical protein